MKILYNYSLKHHNSFAVDSVSPKVFFPSSEVELAELTESLPSSFYILGEGCNTLLVEESSPIIIKPELKGINIVETDSSYLVTAAASENWHNLVCLCIDKGIKGLENLALIPGSVGAAPVQNIGAYGVELAQYCETVSWFDFKTKQIVIFDNKECKFDYRDSIFKNELKNKGLIVDVTFKLPKQWLANLSYAGLDHLPENVAAKTVLEQVISIRRSKLPDPQELPNAGSFFKNPVIDRVDWNKLKTNYPDIPSYPQQNGKVKVAAGWLIQQAGLKGYEENGVGVHKNQALVLVNYSSNTGKNISNLALNIQRKVFSLFGLILEPEVRAVYALGEAKLVGY